MIHNIDVWHSYGWDHPNSFRDFLNAKYLQCKKDVTPREYWTNLIRVKDDRGNVKCWYKNAGLWTWWGT